MDGTHSVIRYKSTHILKKVKNTFDRNYFLFTKIHYIQSAYFIDQELSSPFTKPKTKINLMDKQHSQFVSATTF